VRFGHRWLTSELLRDGAADARWPVAGAFETERSSRAQRPLRRGAARVGGTGYWTVSNKNVQNGQEKGAAITRNPLIYLAPRPGLEPGTYGLTVRRSTD
jgi:hypothetical protein